MTATPHEILTSYIEAVSGAYATGKATEHSYRPAIKALVEALVPGLVATNEPKRIECGAPDIILTNEGVPVGFIETKIPFDDDLEGHGANREQFGRYLAALEKIVFTDFLRFRFFEKGRLTADITLGAMANEVLPKWQPGDSFLSNRIEPNPSVFQNFSDTLRAWCAAPVQSIKSATELSRMMAGKARQIDFVIERALASDIADGTDADENDSLRAQFKTFRELLIHDLSVELFADTYAQTIVYGMFAARLNDTTPDTFDRQEAAELIPKSNPFLRSLFGYISGPDLDDRVKPFIDELAAVFRASDVRAILTRRRSDKSFVRDPIVHFYEDFLRDYDAALRRSRGVWYTPQPVVRFIVRGVDALLRSEFGLKDGLADSSKVRREAQDAPVHRVQVLDPACGTGTFLAEIVRLVRDKPVFAKNAGLWSAYASRDLVPRLNGFELLMASYVIAHIKLELLLAETGAAPDPRRDRLHVYLTNSIEAPNKDVKALFASWLAKEAQAADRVKRDTPVFVVIGNPPYSGESFNKKTWASDLVDAYKKNPTGSGTVPDTKWLNDDYVKFIRFGQHLIENTGEGVLAFITPHGWLDAPTFRGMRHSLLSFFDSIHVLDLHGNSRKKEKTPSGGKDENVFSILQGVEITFFVKKREGKPAGTLAAVRHAELWGKRGEKLAWLDATAFESVPWKPLAPAAPQFYLVPRDNELEEEYKQGIDVSQLFPLGGVGICAKRNELAFKSSKDELLEIVRDFGSMSEIALKKKYPRERKESRDRKTRYAIEDIKKSGLDESRIVQSLYRLFDFRWTYYSGKSKGFLAFPTYDTLKHLLRPNLSLIMCRRVTSSPFRHAFVTDKVTEMNSLSLQTGEQSFVYPLYIYPDFNDSGDMLGSAARRKPNLDAELVAKFAEATGLRFTEEKEETPGTFAPIDILGYIYAVLYSPSYRKRYNSFLKADFPRVPFPESAEKFWRLAALGARLVAVHLLESDELDSPPATYPVGGDHRVDAPAFRDGRIYINKTQYFGGVTERSWNFLIGGYQPAQKWLKDRRGRTLSPADILHYERILRALDLTADIMAEIDAPQ
ncbi:MAG: N-6 DNA methylase [Kiritimatiellae bacterium]|nr:N-6 DNA methylase [Kiritimatiellia bacterium]